MWWPQTNRVPWKTNAPPVGFGNLWLSKRGTKGAVVVVLVVRTFDYDCVCASVRLCVCASVRLCVCAHDFSIDFFGKPMSS